MTNVNELLRNVTHVNELLLYILFEDEIVIDDAVAQAMGAADKHMLVAWIRDAVAQQFVERWALAGEPIDLTGLTSPLEVLDGRALGLRLTDKGRERVDALLDQAHEAGQSDELDEATRRAFDQPCVDYATLMDELANR